MIMYSVLGVLYAQSMDVSVFVPLGFCIIRSYVVYTIR